jgi:hypothetical protein
VVVWLKEGNTNTKEIHGSIKVEEKNKAIFLSIEVNGDKSNFGFI